MDLALTDEQEQLVASFADLLARHASPERVRAAEPGGHDPALWARLHETGVVAMAVPEEAGGWGAALVDLALVAEEVGAALAPSPVLEAQAAARLLARLDSGLATETLGGLLDGTDLVTLALHPAVGGRAALVPGAAVASAVVVAEDERLLLVPLGETVRRPVENLGSMPVADVDVADDAIELVAGEAAGEVFERARDDWLTLTASALVGLAARAHELTCSYAAERLAWGVPIGTYQGVAHPLADTLTALDGARLLARKAAWGGDEGHPRHRELAAMAFAFAAGVARDATYQAVHFHGGYGFMDEHDVQLFYRRARGWARIWGDPATAYRRAATARYAPVLSGRAGG